MAHFFARQAKPTIVNESTVCGHGFWVLIGEHDCRMAQLRFALNAPKNVQNRNVLQAGGNIMGLLKCFMR